MRIGSALSKDYLIFVICIVSILISGTNQYFVQITNMNTTSSKTISDYNKDLALCSCDIHPTICDNYCCCDSKCSSVQLHNYTRLKFQSGLATLSAEPQRHLSKLHATLYLEAETWHSITSHVYIIQTVEISDTFTPIRQQEVLTILQRTNCK